MAGSGQSGSKWFHSKDKLTSNLAIPADNFFEFDYKASPV